MRITGFTYGAEDSHEALTLTGPDGAPVVLAYYFTPLGGSEMLIGDDRLDVFSWRLSGQNLFIEYAPKRTPSPGVPRPARSTLHLVLDVDLAAVSAHLLEILNDECHSID